MPTGKKTEGPKLYLVCGIPVSGKSSIAGEIAAAEKAVILSYEQIRQEIYGSGAKRERGQDKEVFRLMQALFEEALKAGRTIVIDSVNGLPFTRRRYAIGARKRDYRTICIFCHKHCAYAVTANMMREGYRYYADDIKREFDRFVPPEHNEGWNEIRIMDGNRYSLEVEGQIPVERRSAPGKQKR